MVPSMPEPPDLDRAGLRRFGLATGGTIAALFGLVLPILLQSPIPAWPWVVFGVLGVWALATPLSLKPVYRGWMRVGFLLNRITTPVILGIVFFLVIMPMGLMLRVFVRDPMARRWDATAKTYRISSRKAPRENMERPF